METLVKNPVFPTAEAAQGDFVTIYRRSEFFGNIIQHEGKLVRHGRGRYAQYENAPHVVFIPKGKRKPAGMQGSYKPFFLILKGHGHPSPEALCSVPLESTQEGVTVSTSRYQSFDGGWVRDFNQRINAYLAKQEKPLVVADYRDDNGTE